MHPTKDRYRLDTIAGVIDVRVIRAHRDGTVDILCTCGGVRWERPRVQFRTDAATGPDRTTNGTVAGPAGRPPTASADVL